MEEAVLLVRSEVVNEVKEEVVLCETIGHIMTEVAVGRSGSSPQTCRTSVVKGLTTLERETHPEGRRRPATDSQARVEQAHTVSKVHIAVIPCEADGSSIPDFEEPVSLTILDKGSLICRLLSGLLSLKRTSSESR